MAFSHHLVSPYNSLTPCLGLRRFISALQCAAMLYIHPGTPAAGFINGGTPKLRLQANERCLSNSVPPFQETLKGPQIPQASPMDDLSTSPEKHRLFNTTVDGPIKQTRRAAKDLLIQSTTGIFLEIGKRFQNLVFVA